MESLSVLEMILEYYKEDPVKSYWIVQYPKESSKIVQDPVGWGWILDKRERTPQHSVKF